MFWSFWGIIQIFQNCDYSWFCLTIVMETSGKVKKKHWCPPAERCMFAKSTVRPESQALACSSCPFAQDSLDDPLQVFPVTPVCKKMLMRFSLTLLITKSGIKHLRGLGDIDLGLLKLLALLITPPPGWRSPSPWWRSTWATPWRWLTITGHCWGGWKLKILRP